MSVAAEFQELRKLTEEFHATRKAKSMEGRVPLGAWGATFQILQRVISAIYDNYVKPRLPTGEQYKYAGAILRFVINYNLLKPLHALEREDLEKVLGDLKVFGELLGALLKRLEADKEAVKAELMRVFPRIAAFWKLADMNKFAEMITKAIGMIPRAISENPEAACKWIERGGAVCPKELLEGIVEGYQRGVNALPEELRKKLAPILGG